MSGSAGIRSDNALFLVPRNAQSFKWYAGRSDLVTWKDVPQNARDLIVWRDRLEDVYQPKDDEGGKRVAVRSLASLGTTRTRELAEKYGIDYVLTREYPPLLLPVAYSNDTYTILQDFRKHHRPTMKRADSPLKAVVFDLDGLMFNTEDLYQQVGSEVLRRRGKQFTSDLINEMMGRKADKALQLMIDWHGLNDTPCGTRGRVDGNHVRFVA